MKSFIQGVVKILKICAIAAAIGVVVYAGYVILTKNSTIEVNNIPAMPAVDDASEYEERVEQKMEDTQDEWVEKHRVWAEQEVSREIIAEQEQKLEVLREKELSL